MLRKNPESRSSLVNIPLFVQGFSLTTTGQGFPLASVHTTLGTSLQKSILVYCLLSNYNRGLCSSSGSGPWCLTFAPVHLENLGKNLSFVIEIICWVPYILQVQSTRLPSLFLRAQPSISIIIITTLQ